MSDQEDLARHHQILSTQCFNNAWELLERTDRSEAENEEMLRLSMASMWHWSQRSDCTDQNLAMGYWQVSRVHAILGRADEARRYGELCLAASQEAGVAPFALAYAYEALARAAAIAKNEIKKSDYRARAQEVIDTIADADTKKMLLDDLATIP